MAVISTDFLSGVRTNFRALWQDAFLAAQAQAFYPRLCLEVQSTTSIESYNWLGTVPTMKLWIDSRQHQAMYPFNYSLTNNHYEVTIDVDKDTFEDDKLGMIAPRISQLGMEVPRFVEYTAIQALDTGTTSGNNSYDGVTFYNASHLTGANAAQTNLYSATGVTLIALQADFSGAKSQMRRVKDDQGRAMNLVPDIALVPPELEQTMAQLLHAASIPSTSVAAMSNTFQGQADLAVSANLSSASAWHLLATKAGVWKPLIYQNRKPAEFVAVQDPQNPQVFERRMFSYGADTRFVIGYGMWEAAVRIA